jgi:peptidoglycan/xylan/chitin deacetylase (PgdA/CDA1 family)
MYHSISTDKQDPWSVTPQMFTEQMDWLKRKKFNVLSLDQAVEHILQSKNNRKCIVITFDDGYKDFLEAAVPILKKNNFTASIFIPTELIGSTSQWDSFNKNKPLLDWQELKEVARLGYDIGSHSKTHPDLTMLTNEQLQDELSQSKQMLENELHITIPSFSYPFGKYTDREIEAVKNTGYLSAVTVRDSLGNDSKTDVFAIERVAMSNKDSLYDFAVKVSGRKKVMHILYSYLKTKKYEPVA